MTEFDGRFECADLLAMDRNLQVDQSAIVGLSNDDSITMRWDVPYGAAEECKKWLYANRRTMTDFDTPFRHFDGVWRATKIYFVTNRERDGKIINASVLMSMENGLFTEITWAMASRLDGIETSPGNDSSVADVDDTASDDPEVVIRVEFKYCDPLKINEMVMSLNETTYENPEVFGETINGTFHSIFATTRREQDGTHTIILTIANPQYTLQSYSDFGGFKQSDNWYLWRVPKALAQNILDDFKETYPQGVSASANYDNADRLVNITLSKDVNVNLTLETDWIDTACDTKVRYIYGWGMTKAQLDDFIALHDTIPFEGSGGTANGMSRSIETQNRGNGLHDITILEKWVIFDVAKHVVQFVESAGSKTASTHVWGWGVPLTHITSLRSAYETPSQNRKVVFKIDYKGECSYNFELISTVATADTMSTTSAGTGISVGVDIIKNGTTPPSITVNKRQRATVDADINELGSYDAKVVKQTVLESTDSAAVLSAPGGWGTSRWVGKNVDAADLTALITAQSLVQAAKTEVAFTLEAHDDNTFDYAIQKTVVTEVSGSKIGGNENRYYGRNMTALPSLSGERIISIDIQPNADTTINYSIHTETVVAKTEELTGARKIVRSFENVAHANMDDLVGENEILQGGDVKIALDGTSSGTAILKNISSPTTVATKSGEALATVEETHVELSDTGDVPNDGPSDGETIDIRVDIDEESGKVRYVKKVKKDSAKEASITAGSAKRVETVMSGEDVSSLPTLDPSVTGVTIDLEVAQKANGFYSYRGRSVAKGKKSATAYAKSSVGPVNILTAVTVVEDDPEAPESSTDFVNGVKEEYSGVRQNEDGTYNYTKTTTTLSMATDGVPVEGNPLGTPVVSDVIKLADFTERYKEVVWKHYWTEYEIFGYITRNYHRNVRSTIERSYSITRPDDPDDALIPIPDDGSGGATDAQATKEYADGIWVIDKLSITNGPWVDDDLAYKHLVLVRDADYPAPTA